ncbi:MAG: AbrB/MazE/SpoVT family DNA-binding domain-containing protein [Armatimonadota bacterium]
MTAIRVKDKAQITLPVRIRKALGIKEGDYLTVSLEGGKVVLTPQVMLDKLPEATLSAEGKRMVEEAQEDVREGRTEEFDNMQSLIEELKREAGIH